jgi:hypothetical protein
MKLRSSKKILSFVLSISLVVFSFPRTALGITTCPLKSFGESKEKSESCVVESLNTIQACDGDKARASALAGAQSSVNVIGNTGANNTAGLFAEAEVNAKKLECDTQQTKSETLCESAKAQIKVDKATCLACAKAQTNPPGNPAAETAECEATADKLLAEVEKYDKMSLAAKVALGAAALAAFGGIGAMLMKNKKTKDGVSAVAPPPPTNAAATSAGATVTAASEGKTNSDPLCVKNDYTCLCGANRTQKPIECSSSCPFLSNGSPDTACLIKRYGANYAKLAFDKDNNVVDSTVNRSAQMDITPPATNTTTPKATESTAVTTTAKSSGSSGLNGSDMGTPQNYFSKGRVGASSDSEPKAVFDELSEINGLKPSLRASGRSSDTASSYRGSGSSDTRSGGGYKPEDYNKDSQKNAIYAKVMQENREKQRSPANNSKSQIAESNTNLFQNLSAAYQRYQPLMLP